MQWQDRIVVDPKVLVGKPVIRGTRIAVEFVLELLAEGWSREQILQNYPQLTADDLQAALHYAAETLKQENVFPLTQIMAKFLADENVPADAVKAARAEGYDLQWIAEIEPGASDDAVLQRALSSGRVLLTFDKDFGNLVFRRGRPASCGLVLMRPRLRSPDDLSRFMSAVLARPASWEGNFSVASEGKLRIIRLPD